MGVAGIDVHSHGQKILQLGFSLQKASDLCAFNVAEGDKDTLQYNEEVVLLSNGLTPPHDVYIPLGCRWRPQPKHFPAGRQNKAPTPISYYVQVADGKFLAGLLAVERPLSKQALDRECNGSMCITCCQVFEIAAATDLSVKEGSMLCYVLLRYLPLS